MTLYGGRVFGVTKSHHGFLFRIPLSWFLWQKQAERFVKQLFRCALVKSSSARPAWPACTASNLATLSLTILFLSLKQLGFMAACNRHDGCLLLDDTGCLLSFNIMHAEVLAWSRGAGWCARCPMGQSAKIWSVLFNLWSASAPDCCRTIQRKQQLENWKMALSGW